MNAWRLGRFYLFAPVLRFFRINDPYRLLAVMAVMVALALLYIPLHHEPDATELKAMVVGEALMSGQAMYADIFDSTAPLAAVIFGLVDFLFGRSLLARDVLALIILFFQVGLFAVTLIQHKAYAESTYVPALVFGVLCFWSYDLLQLSEELLGSLLLLSALGNIFKEIEFRVQRDETVLNLGVLIGLASLLLFSYAIFLPAVMVLLLVYARLDARRLLLIVFGFVLPHLAVIMAYWVWDGLPFLWAHFYLPYFGQPALHLISLQSLLALAALPLVYLTLSLLILTREGRFTKYQSQLFQVMFIWLLFAILQIIMTHQLTPHSFITCIPPIAYFISHLFLLIRRKWLAESLALGLIITIPATGYVAATNGLAHVDYTDMRLQQPSAAIKGKRLMVLGDLKDAYAGNMLAGPYFDWHLSEPWLNMDYYENVLLMHHALQHFPPDIIIDPDNRMEGVWKHMPEIAKKYRRQGATHYLLNN
jgi:hypothetical protein